MWVRLSIFLLKSDLETIFFNFGREGNYLTMYQRSWINPRFYQFTVVNKASGHHFYVTRSDSLGNCLDKWLCIGLWYYLKSKVMLINLYNWDYGLYDSRGIFGRGNLLLIIFMYSYRLYVIRWNLLSQWFECVSIWVRIIY